MFYSIILYLLLNSGLTAIAPALETDSTDYANRPDMEHRDDGGQTEGGGGK